MHVNTQISGMMGGMVSAKAESGAATATRIAAAIVSVFRILPNPQGRYHERNHVKRRQQRERGGERLTE
jgi:hypothetical protein